VETIDRPIANAKTVMMVEMAVAMTAPPRIGPHYT